jgi:predicted metalloprotease with PDZ domain
LLYDAREDYSEYRRSVDYYDEGTLIWLDADVLIRQLSKEKKSLNDFCRSFEGGPGGAPALKPYTFDDVVSALNSVQPYDWAAFLRERVNSVAPHAPLGGIENGGYKLIFNSTRSELFRYFEDDKRVSDMTYSIGMVVKDDGTVQDVALGGLAQKAGIAPTDKLVAIDNRQFTATLLRETVQATASNTKVIEFLVKSGEYYSVHKVEYQGGEKFPHLVRDPDKTDVINEIVQPLAKR